MGGYSGGRAGVGEHEGGAVDLDLGVADAALGHGHSDACVKWVWCRPQLILPMRVCRRYCAGVSISDMRRLVTACMCSGWVSPVRLSLPVKGSAASTVSAFLR